LKKIIESPGQKEIVEAFHNEETVFLCPELSKNEKEYYSTIFKQFAPSGSVCFLSSGSSGNPKVHAHSWFNIKKRAKAQAKELGLDKDSVYLNPLPLHHLGGFMPVIRSLLSESSQVIKRKDQSLEDSLSKVKPTHVSMVPTQLAKLVKNKVDLSFLDTLLLGGSGCSESILVGAKDLLYPVRACYGMTESASFFSIGKKEEFLKDAKIMLYLMDNWNAFTTKNGRLTIESNEMFLGTIEALGFKESRGMLPTFDLGEVDAPSIKIYGRSDLVYKSGGEKVDPLEVERKLESTGLFSNIVIVPKESEVWGNITTAFISPFKRGRDYSLLTEHLPSHQRPKFFFPLALTTGIKPKRSELKEIVEKQIFKDKKLPRMAFLHGFMGSANDLKELGSSLREFCAPVFWSLPFHGKIKTPEEFNEVIDFYVEKIRNEDIDVLYGYSMGGRLATAIASRLQELGEPLAGLILESSHPGLKDKEEKEKRLLSDQTLFDRMPTEPQAFFEKWYSASLFGDFKESDLGKISIKEMQRRWRPTEWKKTLELLSTGKQKDFQPFLLSTLTPILYLCGEQDIKYKNMALLLKNQEAKALSVKCLENGFHNLHLNNLDQLKAPISELLSSLN
jgi:2-succinyl-6-hydroxy-2,4-cyclohexadiene-1-carboxylate synthase